MRTLVDADGLIYIGGFAPLETEDEDKILAFRLKIVRDKLRVIQHRYPGTMEVYLKGEGNFRDEVATIRGYKANRTAPKPEHYEEIIDYLQTHWGAILVRGQEADDEVSIRQRELNYQAVVCTLDKDLDQIPGKHWNYKKNVEYDVDPFEAKGIFWKQVLTGDTTDNIIGCWKCGDAKATAVLEDLLDENEIWQRVVETYEESMGIEGCEYAGMPPELVALEMARLVYMRQERNELWTPPGEPTIYMLEDM